MIKYNCNVFLFWQQVRCLGKGRPFVLELLDSRKTTLPTQMAADMEIRVDKSELVSIHHLQLVKRYN